MSPSADHLLKQLSAFPDTRRWFVALSGGLDSVVLLHLAKTAGLAESHSLTAVHVNHGLQTDADSWACHCQSLCADWGILLIEAQVDVAKGASLEAQARDARYQAFAQILKHGDGLLMAHHQDDQAETVLLRLLRGSGPKGLSAIPKQRQLGDGYLFRPLLAFSRKQLQEYAEQQQLDWIEDPSNSTSDFDRNFLRLEVMPLLRQRWPHMADVFQQSAGHCAEAEGLNQQLAEIDYRQVCRDKGLECEGLKALSPERQRNLLRFWLRAMGAPVPAKKVLARIVDELLSAREDAEPLVAWSGIEVRRYQEVIYLTCSQKWQIPEVSQSWDWHEPLQFGFGILSAQQADGVGLALDKLVDLEVRFRQGGERIRPIGRQNTRPLKKLLQESGIPPWNRSQLPLIYAAGELVAVADLWIADGYEAGPDEAAIKICWQTEFSVDLD